MNDVTAIAKGIRMSPRKVGLVASLVRGRTVSDALVILEHTPKRAAKPVAKIIQSASANATHNHRLDVKTLSIKTIEVNGGGMMKRFRPVAHGRAHPYRHRITNITVVVSGEVKSKPAAKPANTKEKK